MNALFRKHCPSTVVPVHYYSTIQPYNYSTISSTSYDLPPQHFPAPVNQFSVPQRQFAFPPGQFAAPPGIPVSYTKANRGLNIIMVSSLILLSLDLIFVRPLKQKN
ncbi:hypothetical protein Sgly_1858 [Syntrophobotulus glycolicus DSM 8271]|uniref:Uncharacterized protein n=2 Tax=Syntrophobotulus TaxID=51196 RepID=F0T068_SYNGF|nr:hypothetical protein Sgly_1858 [Syntrophobotulus glycolicus DSM 8271]